MRETEKPSKSLIAEKEEKILEFWKENKIFEKSLEKPAPNGEFVFYDGPATANAKPVFHTMEPFAFKDIIPRYKTMRGYHVARKGGWDTHGLPVELQIEKKLGFKSKKDIEEYGIEAFNKLCKESVWEYIGLWKDFTSRMGYWADQEHPYVTYDNSYIESVWNIVKTVNDKKLLYKDYKVLPWCPRCGTALSSHELAQGYQDDKDLSVTVKFKVTNPEKIGLSGDVYLLAWTTTPWTLPGNVALAVGEDIEYKRFKILESKNSQFKVDDIYVLSNDFFLNLAFAEGSNYKGPAMLGPTVLKRDFEGIIVDNIEVIKSQNLIGLKYEPLYNFLSEKFKDKNSEAFEKAYQVYAADFVNTEDGTGIVHTAVMYGQDDFVLGTKMGLPKYHLVQEDGHFQDGMDFLSKRFVKDEEVAVDIIKDLAHRGLLFKKEKYEHSYPHCWRCKTPLIYYARDSWYIKMSSLREELVKENENIHWEPEHIKEGRFGEWLREIKDWAISRERYWGTPLPVWSDKEGNYRVIGSIDELKKHIKTNKNRFIFIRHGEAENNTANIINCDQGQIFHLTERGRKEVENLAKKIEKADVVFTSPYMRVRETAEIVAKTLSFDLNKIQEDKRLAELNFGEFNGKTFTEYLAYEEKHITSYDTPLPGGESYNDAKLRLGEFLYEIDKKYQGKTIVIVTHGIGLEVAAALLEGADLKRSKEIIDNYTPAPGEVLEFDFIPLPHNANYELDLHRPFIDQLELVDENGASITRSKEVLDVWFDSGAMPFAQNHYPFENSGKDLLYPADYISEALDQTRGWFYTLHAIGILMGKGKAFKNVICLGHILDAQGKKMSKSIGNVLDPGVVMDKYGADALRFWMYSVNQPGDSKNFDEKTVDEIIKKVFNPAENILAFYDLYKEDTFVASDKSKNVLDKWIVTRLNELTALGTKSLDDYKIFEATRAIRDFVNDFSTWYIRRSRDRFKSDNLDERKEAISTTRFIFLELAKYMAPFTPFFAESAYLRLRHNADPESVHLCDWPEVKQIDKSLLDDMYKVREVVTSALELRQKAGHKVRQPLATLTIPNDFEQELLDILADEVNVKKVVVSDGEIKLDTKLTEELIEEGKVRDAIHTIQEWRKEKNLKPGEKASYDVPESDKEFFSKYSEAIKKSTNVEF